MDRTTAGTARRGLAGAWVALAVAGFGCSGDQGFGVPLDPDSPFPKFRANALQDGRVDRRLRDDGRSEPWVFVTGKGIFSTPVIDGDGNIYVGSADRVFYSLAPDGTERWRYGTGEIIDSAALLDDQGRVYVGSGDGYLYAFDRDDGGEPLWRFAADPPRTYGGLINWFEGNVAIGPDGTLYVPNDNFCTYAVDRATGESRWCFRTLDQTWSLPAVHPRTGRLFIGNNALLPGAPNVYGVNPEDGSEAWRRSTAGSVAASPLLTDEGDDGLVVVGSFDGFVRAYRQDGEEVWSFAARDHIYASPGELPDGTIVQPAADGTVYALDPADGSLRWAFDTLEPIRSSPAIDRDGVIYVGSGEGRLFVLNPDGTLRWAMRCTGAWRQAGSGEIVEMDARRSDLNASPALGPSAVVIAGENGGVYAVPYDYCLRDAAASDARCTLGPAEDLPPDGTRLLFLDRFGGPRDPAPEAVEGNQALAFGLFQREGGDTRLALIDDRSLAVTVRPEVPVEVDVSGDRRFLTVFPTVGWAPAEGGEVTLELTGAYLVDPQRDGLRTSGGRVAGTFEETLTFTVPPRDGRPLALEVPAEPGDPGGILELYRLAAPLPTILPSYNQIGFDSIHYLVGLVEGTPERAIAWGVGAAPNGPDGATVVDPTSRVRFALELESDGGLMTLANEDGFTIEFNGFALPFALFRVAARVDERGFAPGSASILARTICGEINLYGPFLQRLGFCNPESDLLLAYGAAELRPHAGGVQQAPDGVGDVTFAVEAGAIGPRIVATLEGSELPAGAHNLGILLVDPATGRPISADYVRGTLVSEEGGLTVSLGAPEALPTPFRAYLMVDAYPAARADLEPLPAP